MARKQELPVCPCLFYVLSANDPVEYDPRLTMDGEPVNDIAQYEADYFDELTKVVTEIYDPERAFVQTENRKACEYCDFKRLCGR